MADYWGYLLATTKNPRPPINTNTTPPSFARFNFKEEYETFSLPINTTNTTSTTPSSLPSFTFNEEEYDEAFSFLNMVQQLITNEYPDLLDQMLAPYCSTTSTTTSTTTTSSNGIILNSNSTDFVGQSHNLPPDPVLLGPPSKKRRQHVQNQQKQFFQVQTGGKTSAKIRKSLEKKMVFYVTEDQLLSSDSWAWRKYGQKSIKGTPYPRNYFRCNSSSCAARKRVERSNMEDDMFMITYTGEHSHVWPTQQSSLAGTTRNNSLSKISA